MLHLDDGQAHQGRLVPPTGDGASGDEFLGDVEDVQNPFDFAGIGINYRLDEIEMPLNERRGAQNLDITTNLRGSQRIELKRQLDQTAHISAPLFDGYFLQQYNALINRCFATFGGWGDDARLRTLFDRRRKVAGEDWSVEWEDCFASCNKVSQPSEVKKAYVELMEYLARAIGADQVDAHMLESAQVPGDFERRAAGMVSQTISDDEARES